MRESRAADNQLLPSLRIGGGLMQCCRGSAGGMPTELHVRLRRAKFSLQRTYQEQLRLHEAHNFQSQRNAMRGSIFVARAAGTEHARSATIASVAPTTT